MSYVTYQLDDHGEAVSVHYYCSPACRTLDREANRGQLMRTRQDGRPATTDGEDPPTIDGLLCEYCSQPIDPPTKPKETTTHD